MPANYFFIDGSALTAQVRQLRRENALFLDRKLCVRSFIRQLVSQLIELSANEHKRATFYFPVGDETAIEDFLLLPDHQRPGEVRDIHLKFCGQKLKKSKAFNEFVETKVPPEFRDRFNKSEKGIDIEICCDALRLASASRLERLFLLTNDDDFIPFCRTIKEFGANISIVHLSGTVVPNKSLLREADSYDVVHKDRLHDIFLPSLALEPPQEEAITGQAPSSAVKPDADPSDLVIEKLVGSPEDKTKTTEEANEP